MSVFDDILRVHGFLDGRSERLVVDERMTERKTCPGSSWCLVLLDALSFSASVPDKADGAACFECYPHSIYAVSVLMAQRRLF